MFGHKNAPAQVLSSPCIPVHALFLGTPSRTRTWDPLIKNQNSENQEDCNPLENKELAESKNEGADYMARCGAFIREKLPDLGEVIDLWDQLPDAVRNGILAMVRSFKS